MDLTSLERERNQCCSYFSLQLCRMNRLEHEMLFFPPQPPYEHRHLNRRQMSVGAVYMIVFCSYSSSYKACMIHHEEWSPWRIPPDKSLNAQITLIFKGIQRSVRWDALKKTLSMRMGGPRRPLFTDSTAIRLDWNRAIQDRLWRWFSSSRGRMCSLF